MKSLSRELALYFLDFKSIFLFFSTDQIFFEFRRIVHLRGRAECIKSKVHADFPVSKSATCGAC